MYPSIATATGKDSSCLRASTRRKKSWNPASVCEMSNSSRIEPSGVAMPTRCALQPTSTPIHKVGIHVCASLQHEFVHSGDHVYCSEPHPGRSCRATSKLLSLLSSPPCTPRTFLDGTKDGGGISEPSSQRLPTPSSSAELPATLPPSRSVYINEGIPSPYKIQRLYTRNSGSRMTLHLIPGAL